MIIIMIKILVGIWKDRHIISSSAALLCEEVESQRKHGLKFAAMRPTRLITNKSQYPANTSVWS